MSGRFRNSSDSHQAGHGTSKRVNFPPLCIHDIISSLPHNESQYSIHYQFVQFNLLANSSSLLLLLTLFRFPIVDRGANSVLRQHRTVELNRRQFQMRGNVRIFNCQHLIDVFALYPFCGDGTGGDGRSAAEGFEFRFLDVSVFVHEDLELS